MAGRRKLRNDILRGNLRKASGFDVLGVQDIPEIHGADDAAVLSWATANGRALLTHDMSTMIPAWKHSSERRGPAPRFL